MIVLLAILSALSSSVPNVYFNSRDDYYSETVELYTDTYTNTTEETESKGSTPIKEDTIDGTAGWIFLIVVIVGISVLTIAVTCYSAYRHGRFRAMHVYFIERWGKYLPRMLAGGHRFEVVRPEESQIDDELGTVTDTGETDHEALD